MLDTTLRRRRIETWTLSADELKAIFRGAERDTYIVYAVGDLAHERQTAIGAAWAQAEKCAAAVYSLYENGDAELTQKKLAPNRYEYRVHKV